MLYHPRGKGYETLGNYVQYVCILLVGSCSVNQECISIKQCPYTKELFSQVKSTSNPDEKAKLIQAIRLRVCGEPSDRTVCCDIDQGRKFREILEMSPCQF